MKNRSTFDVEQIASAAKQPGGTGLFGSHGGHTRPRLLWLFTYHLLIIVTQISN
jgi:hypothetical protein